MKDYKTLTREKVDVEPAGRSPPGRCPYCMMTTFPASIRSARLVLK